MTSYLKKRPRAAADDKYGLTYHERRVVDMLIECRRLSEIATVLGTSYGSTKSMAVLAYRKIGVAGQIELLAKMRAELEVTEAGRSA